jgi:hypothetical protein
MQLVAYGAQDVYLTGMPQITFFKVVYRRHTNFSVEPIPQTFNGASDFGRTVTCTINRNGDLITNMYVNIVLGATQSVSTGNDWGFVRRLGLATVQHYKIEIGGSKLDEQYGDWLNIWYELSHKTGQERGYAKMVGDVPELTTINTAGTPQYLLYVPLQFWFNRNNGLALPLIALQYHDVRVSIDFRPAAQVVNKVVGASTPTVTINDAQLIIDYVYLDSEERKRFAQASHEYLFEQLQFTGAESLSSINNKYRLNFNHPSKFLIWAPHLQKYTSGNQFIAYSPSAPESSDWQTALDKYAKVMWLATRTGLSAGTPYTVGLPVGVELEVTQPGKASWVSSLIDSKVQAQAIFSFDISGSTPTTFTATPDNVVLLSNNFTLADLSLGGSSSGGLDLLQFGTPSATATTFVNLHSIVVQDWFNYGNHIDGTDNPVVSAKLQLNGSDRFQERDGYYFNYVQPWQHFSNTPADGINTYSFSLKPEDHQPSGTCNFSRIDNATLQITLGSGNVAGSSTYLAQTLGGANGNSLLNIYTVNYNVLRVMAGMAGAAYSN